MRGSPDRKLLLSAGDDPWPQASLWAPRGQACTATTRAKAKAKNNPVQRSPEEMEKYLIFQEEFCFLLLLLLLSVRARAFRRLSPSSSAAAAASPVDCNQRLGPSCKCWLVWNWQALVWVCVCAGTRLSCLVKAPRTSTPFFLRSCQSLVFISAAERRRSACGRPGMQAWNAAWFNVVLISVYSCAVIRSRRGITTQQLPLLRKTPGYWNQFWSFPAV